MNKRIFLKTLLVTAMLGVGANAWADEVLPTPVYFNDFSFATSGSDGIEIVGNGVFENDADARFGRVFHNDPGDTPTKAIRTNYLKLPDHVLSHSTETKEITIGFWVNVKNAADYWFTPIFSAYAISPAENAAASRLGNEGNFPMFVLQSRGLMQLNNGGYDDFYAVDNVKGSNLESTVWLDDKAWHYYTMTMTTSSAKIYVDGDIINEWNIAGTDGHYVEGFFTYGMNYKYICLGGNQAWNWGDPDPAYAFDDLAIYSKALTKAQIDQIRANKLDRTVTGTAIGAVDSSTDYLGASSSTITLKPGESYHYHFINYGKGENNWNNWILPVYNANDDRVITVRADNWEDMHHVGDTWGSNAGCTSNFNWTDFPGNINGATVDMTVTFTVDKKFTMACTINTVDGSEWSYSYSNDYTDSPISLTSNDYIKVALSVSRSWLDLKSEGYSAIAATIRTGSSGFATLYTPYALDFSKLGSSLKVYTATLDEINKKVTLIEVSDVPANTGVVLKGDVGTHSIPVVTSSSTDKGNLIGSATEALVWNDGLPYDYYMLALNGEAKAVFTKFISGTIAAGKAYLAVTKGSSVRDFSVLFEDDVTGIETINRETMTNYHYFNLAGQHVVQPTKGIYIVNGKKVVVK